ncbi:MAG TPA: kelch repeat-containing protein, partial [Byssovorax sp.]
MLGHLRSRRTRLVASGVLAALAGACSSAPVDPVARVEAAFPAHAAAVFGARTPGFSATPRGFAPIAGSKGATARASIELPALGSGDVLMHARDGLDVRVREVGATGVGVLARGAAVYARAGITSFWTQNQGVSEEWAHLDASRVHAGEPVLAWEIAGARLAQAGDAVDVLEPSGRVALHVVAPEAFGDGERPVKVRLRAIGARIELFAEAAGEALLVDPMWIPAASLPAPTYNHTAALLQTGEVLVAGGEPGIIGGEYNTAEVYDPAADTWTPVGKMFVARTNHTATTLVDGTVLEVGGVINGGGLFLASAETYD